MGSVRANIKLTSADVLSTSVDINSALTLTADSGNINRLKVLATAKGDASVQTIHKANEKLNRAYLYVKNLGGETEKYAYIFADTSSDDPVVAKLGGGEFCFMPVDPAVNLKVYATDVDQIVEYAVFGLDSSAVRYS
jgi:hypothetical protein|tara:strand:+ start:441 stop:851 length:411 start_codon:yes stop_codon:yes gene_type:complete